MSRFEAEISGGRGQGFQQQPPHGWRGGGRGAAIPPPPPPAIILNRGGGGGPMSTNPFRGGGGAITQSAPSFYASAPQTNAQAVKANNEAAAEQDDDDIFASLEQAEKEFKKEVKRKAKKGLAPDGVVAAKKPKLAVAEPTPSLAAKAKPFVPPQLHNLQIPHSTQARMTQAAKPPQPVMPAKPVVPQTLKAQAGLMPMPAAIRQQPGASASSGLPSGVKAPPTATMTNEDSWKKAKSKKKIIRTGGGQIWEDDTLKDWDQSDFRVFCGDLGNDVTDEVLARTFGRYPSFQKAKVIRDKKTNKTKGFGFISFKEPGDFTKAMREMNGKYVGSRPIKMRKSNWKDRNIDVVRQKQKSKQEMGYKW